jgi:putative hydrolase of the HAD superfamily
VNSTIPLEIQAILFDFGNTLVYPLADWQALFVWTARRIDPTLQPNRLVEAYRRVVRRLPPWPPAVDFAAIEAYKHRFSAEFTEEIGKGKHEGWDLLNFLTQLKKVAERRRLYPGVKGLLEMIRTRNYRMGIISVNYGTLEDQCRKLGILQFFDVLIDSARVGFLKPNPRIFQVGLERLNLSPSEALYVGDSYWEDIIGARAAGMHTVWVSHGRIRADRFEADLEVQDIREIGRLLLPYEPNPPK